MEVDDEYDWKEEARYKPVEGLLPVSKDWAPQSIYWSSIALKL